MKLLRFMSNCLPIQRVFTRTSRRQRLMLACLALLMATGTAFAAGGPHGGPQGLWGARMQAQLEEALAQAKATPAQSAAVFKERDAMQAQRRSNGKARHGLHKAMADAFVADKLDPVAVARLREQSLQARNQGHELMLQALVHVHDVFSAEQRKALVAYAQNERPKLHAGNWQSRMMRHMAERKTDELLSKIQATPAQKATIVAARDKVLTTFEAQMGNHQAQMDETLQLFAAERMDNAKLEALATKRDAQARDIADVVVKAISDIHAVLTPAQRKQAADFLSQMHREHGERGSGEG